MSQKTILKNILQSGKNLTVSEIARLGDMSVESVYKRVADLRNEGYSVYRNENAYGETTYRLGRPSRAIVARAYAAAGAELFV